MDTVLIEGFDHELVEYSLIKEKVVSSGGGAYYTSWFENYPLEEGDEIIERWVGR